MKHFNLYLIALLTILFTACSDDDSMNSVGSTTVSFKQSEISFNENAGIVKVPLNIEGERNGLIKVTLKVEDGSAIAEGHYISTSNIVYIPTSATGEIGCELRLLDDGMNENDDRDLKISIVSVEGAEVGNTSTCRVILKDVDKNPYFKLMGNWTFHAVDAKGTEVSFAVTISDGGKEDNVEKSYVFSGFKDGAGYTATIPWTVDYNKAAGTLSLLPGATYAKYNFGFVGEVRICPLDIDRELLPELKGTWNKTFDKIEFDPNGIISSAVFNSASGDYEGYWVVYAECSMTKK